MEECLKLERGGVWSRLLTLAAVFLLSVFMIICANGTDYRRLNVGYTEGIIETNVESVENVIDGIEMAEFIFEIPGEEILDFPKEQPVETAKPTEIVKPDGGITDIPDTKPSIPVIPDAGDEITDVPSDETGEDLEADEENDAEADVIFETPFLIDEAGMIYGFAPEHADIAEGILFLPTEGCVGIRSGAFLGMGTEILELYIPANITVIEEGALSGMNMLEWIETDMGNEAYISIEGVLFDSTMTSLYTFPAGRTGTYKVPASVTYIAYGAFDGTALTEIDLRECLDIDCSVMAGCPANLILPRE